VRQGQRNQDDTAPSSQPRSLHRPARNVRVQDHHRPVRQVEGVRQVADVLEPGVGQDTRQRSNTACLARLIPELTSQNKGHCAQDR